MLRQILLSGFVDQVAVRSASEPSTYSVASTQEPAKIHASSVLTHSKPDWVVYERLIRTSHLFLSGATAIEASWVVSLCEPMIKFSPPLDVPAPRFASKNAN